MALTQAYVSDSGGGGGGGGGVDVSDEGSVIVSGATEIDFVGAGVTVTNVGGVPTATIPGGTTPAEVLITETVLGASAATITFSSIAATWRDLRLVLRGRGTTAATFCRPRLQMNGDTGSNYDWQRWNVHGTGGEAESGAGVTYIDIGLLPASTGPSNQQGSIDLRIFNYRGTTFTKPVVHQNIGSALGSHYAIEGGGWWKSTSAITSLTWILDAGNYDVGTIASLYGIL